MTHEEAMAFALLFCSGVAALSSLTCRYLRRSLDVAEWEATTWREAWQTKCDELDAARRTFAASMRHAGATGHHSAGDYRDLPGPR